MIRDAMPVGGLRVGTPVIVSMYLGLGPTFFGGTDSCREYWQLVIEPGVGGGQIGFAYGIGRRETSVRLQPSVLRTWGPSWHAPRGKSFAGAEIQVAHEFGLRVGYFRRLGSGDERRRLYTIGVTLGH